MERADFRRNNLDLAASAYLRQHAGNPVWWQEWSPGTLAHAALSGRPLFVSVGYATCHWCHVMAAEVFSDQGAAEALNSGFVCVKVDRQERPDLDRYLMDFMTINYGQGGWPLNVALTPGGAPFAAATYIPLRADFGRMGFVDYLERILGFYREQGAMVRPFEIPGQVPDGRGEDGAALEARVSAWRRGLDQEWGGLGKGQKFPPHTSLLFLLYAAAGADSAGYDGIRALVEPTLDMMSSGGLHDHLQGGFFRYCTDREWTIPHFEKMLYDQAQSLWVYALAARLLHRFDYAATARGALRCLRESFERDGLFIAGLDADTEHREGATYLWSRDELGGVLGAGGLAELEAVFGISGRGNFEGKNHLVMRNRRPEAARKAGLPEASLSEESRMLLLAARRKRPQPEPDGLVVTSWNALAGIALVHAWRLLGDGQALEEASRLFDLLLERHYSDGSLYRSSFGGRLNGTTYLEDAAAMLLFAGYLHEEDRSRGAIIAELKALTLSFRDGAEGDAAA